MKNKDMGIPIIEEKYLLLKANIKTYKKVDIQNDFAIV
jgi:hypothetical protein